VTEMQQQNLSHQQAMADKDYLMKKIDRLRDQLNQSRADKDRLFEQAREDKALMAKALQELQKQLAAQKEEKEHSVALGKAEQVFLTNENAQLKQRIAELQSGGGSSAINARQSQLQFEADQLRGELEHAQSQRDHMERRLGSSQLQSSQSEDVAKERARLSTEISNLRDEVERLRMEKAGKSTSPAHGHSGTLGDPDASRLAELEKENGELRDRVKPLPQVLSERDMALRELQALTDQVEQLRSRGSLEGGSGSVTARLRHENGQLAQDVEEMTVLIKQANAERDILHKYVVKLEAELDRGR